MNPPALPLQRLIDAFRRRRPQRAGSLIVTIFGDMIAPRGGQVLLGDLTPLLRAFAVNDSQARTALSRLVDDGWLKSRRLGRRSLYRLTEQGAQRFAAATRQIYFSAAPDWHGQWTVALLAPMPKAAQAMAARQLGWLGFGALASTTLLHPHPDAAALGATVEKWPQAQRPLILEGVDAGDPARLRALARQAWPLARLERDYRKFASAFAPFAEALGARDAIDPFDAACARVILVHEFRRIILRDPLLPPAVLPPRWPGATAYATARAIYRRITGPGELWIDRHLTDGVQPLPAPATPFNGRFS